MKITTARNWYGEGSGIVIKTDDYLITLHPGKSNGHGGMTSSAERGIVS